MRVSSVIIVLVLVGAVGFLVLTFGGWMAVGWFRKETFDKGLAVAQGYTKATTPAEAMDLFRSAIQARNYESASYYCTKDYSEYLKRTHTAAKDLGRELDRIRTFGKEKAILTDKVQIVLHRLDPFPLNFKVGPVPKEDAKGKTVGSFEWQALVLKNPGMVNQIQLQSDVKDFDWTMFENVLGPPMMFGKVELVKEDDSWKLHIPTNQVWDRGINNFLAKSKTYHTGLGQFAGNMSAERYADPPMFEAEIFSKLRSAAR